jgi:uncharacterized protein
MDAPAAEVTLSPDDVRRMTLRAQGFLGATSWPRARASRGSRVGVSAMLHRVGAVQLDTISVLARSHELVAYARLGPVSRQAIEQAYWHASRPAAFEYWAHAACVLPIEQWPYFAFRRRAFRARGVRWHQISPEACDKVLARLRAEGPLTATQLGGAKGGGPWWDWSDVKIAVEWLLDTGEVICVRRTGWRRVYDLPERVLPDELLGAEPSDAECLAHLAGVTARALGVATQADLTEYHRLSLAQTRLMTDAVLAAGLTPVAIAGLSGSSKGSGTVPGWADPDALAQESAGRRGRHRVTLLSPFDSLIWDRKRTRQVFGFHHAIEAYVPKPKRVHGYYAMPLLARQVSLDRASAAEPMAQALREAASWVGCDDVRLERVEPAAWAPRLAAALTQVS